MKLSRSLLLSAIFLGISLLCQAASTPNFVFILADDLGSADVGWRGSEIPTPNLDRLAKAGVELTAHYTAPVCSPTRAGLLTGRYWSRFGITVPNSFQCLPDGTPTLATLLRERGYQTALIGKWHLGGAMLTNKWPAKFGFDYSYGSLDGAVHPFTHVYTSGGTGGDDGAGVATWHRNGDITNETGHVTDLLVKEAIAFIERAKAKPFFLYLPFSAPHEKCLETPEWMEKCRHIPADRRTYAAMIAHLDDAVGKIVAELDAAGLRENTIIVFASDNGGVNQGRNEPLRGKKAEVYEGGIRNLAFVNWPGQLLPGKNETPFCLTDWLPTLGHLAGAKIPPSIQLDGVDLWPSLAAKNHPTQMRDIYISGLSGKSAALRRDDWKLVCFLTNQPVRCELYNLKNDPFEKNDLATAQPAKVSELFSALKKISAADNTRVAPELLKYQAVAGASNKLKFQR